MPNLIPKDIQLYRILFFSKITPQVELETFLSVEPGKRTYRFVNYGRGKPTLQRG
jgi:hypothetical protein